ncbi:hypothetical protein BKH23_08230 [Actinomyces oris]|uniref:RCC1 domain-containing protein n=1 Tax=Actinomyces TaxID=1654 RepID=UPI00094D02EC|nr:MULTISPECIES: hypothetical protein [Actinomyces]OLO60696.1 hypothetical protein BKH23_08230 [Actinomyces oris]
MDDRMLDGDRVLWFIGGSPERAREALATGHAWTPEQRAQLEQIAASAGYSPQQPAGYLPAQQQVPVQDPASLYGAPADPVAFDGAFRGDGARGDTVDYGATQPAQQPAGVAPPQPQMATQPQPQGYRLQPLPMVTEMEAPQSDVSQYSSDAPRRGWVLPVVAVSVLALGLVGGALGGHWLWPGKNAAAPSPSAAAAPAATKPATLRAGSGSFVCSSGGTGVSCWGADAQANTQGARVSPTAVPGLEKVKVSALSVGKGFAVAVDDSGKVYAWGANEVGQLGKKTNEALVNQAVEVGKLPAAPTALVSGYEHTCALAKGTVWCFGSNRYGQVNGTVSDTPSGLVQVDKISGATQIGTSGYDTWATVDKGTWTWGNNSWGQADPSQSVVNVAPTLIPASS